ncbi:MAG: hypothetical protein M3014_14700 [Chloroflexota bacterium]|nr:hypothetical protein [Chloroflexota bacterium]
MYRLKRTARLLPAWLLLLMLLLASPSGIKAQGSANWTRLGSLPENTQSIASDASNHALLYSLAADGVQHSIDSGATWKGCNAEARYMRAVPPDPGRQGPTLLYAVTRSGLRVSEDGCITWRDVRTQGVAPSGSHIRWLATYPNNRAVIYAGMDGLGGLYRTTDTGASWQPASKGLPPNAWATALTADPTSPQQIYLGLRYTSEKGTPAYLYKSADGGLTWRSSSMGLHIMPNNGGRITGLGWSGQVLFAATSSDGLYASTDHGDTWHQATLPRSAAAEQTPAASLVKTQPLPLQINSFASTPDGALFITTPDGGYWSLDGAHSWQHFGPDAAGPSNLLLSVAGERALLGGSSGLWSYNLPGGAVTPPTPATAPATAVPPTPPPPAILPTNTPQPTATRALPTATNTPRPTATIALVPGPHPSDRVQAADPATYTYFPQTGHNLGHGFRDFWQSHGGVGQFGYPLTEEFTEKGVPVQYFERARLEYHDGTITLGLLGSELTQGQFFLQVPFFVSTDSNIYFGPTKHSTSGPFLDYFRLHGRIDFLGYPISESIPLPQEGYEYQWFERARLEWHRDFPEGKKIILGAIGTEALQKRGWIK